jgi:hypothetical protein
MRAKDKVFERVANLADNLTVDIGVDSNASGIAFTNRAGNTTISQRFKPADALDWLDGFTIGFSLGRASVLADSNPTTV